MAPRTPAVAGAMDDGESPSEFHVGQVVWLRLTNRGARNAKLFRQLAFIEPEFLLGVVDINLENTVAQHLVDVILQGEIDRNRF